MSNVLMQSVGDFWSIFYLCLIGLVTLLLCYFVIRYTVTRVLRYVRHIFLGRTLQVAPTSVFPGRNRWTLH